MTKKELPKTMRPMFGFTDKPKLSMPQNLAGTASAVALAEASDKDALIAHLRASLEELTAKNRARVAKHREKKRAKP